MFVKSRTSKLKIIQNYRQIYYLESEFESFLLENKLNLKSFYMKWMETRVYF